MKTISGKDLAKAPEAKGWVLDRVGGSHHVYKLSGEFATVTVPIHGSRDLKRGTQLTLMKQAGLTEADI